MRARVLVLLLFLVSGALGLVYEVVWARQLSLIFGISVFATSTVLASYMAGLAIGSVLVGRFIDRSPNPVRVYALLEGGIGLAALAMPFLLDAVHSLYLMTSAPLEDHFLLLNALRASMAFVALLLPTTLMGGTVPAIGRYLIDARERIGWNVGLLYALNTLGAVVGVLAAGFWLVPELGLAASTAIAAAGNLAVAGVLLASGVRAREPAPTPSEAPADSRSHDSEPTARRAVVLASTVFTISGFAALAYEVIWTRVLVIHVFNTSYAFSLMLAVFLTGLALGDLVMIRAYDRVRRPLLWLGVVQILIGLSVVVATATYGPVQELSAALLKLSSASSFTEAVFLMISRAALVMLPFTFLLGMTFPLVARTVLGQAGALGRSLGRIYALNTLGAVLGALAASFALVPLLGIRGSILLLSAVNIVLGVACALEALPSRGARLLLVPISVFCLGLPHWTIPRTLFSDALASESLRVIYYREGIADTTAVLELQGGGRMITYGDGRGTAGTFTNRFNRVQGHLAHLLHPNPVRSLQIGFGVGNTLASAALHPEVEELGCVELSPHVRETAPFFWTNDDVLSNPKVHLTIEDGRNHLLRTRTRYHVITLEPPNIYTANVINLYTREFYEVAANALEDDGLLVQWISVADVTDEHLKRMVRAVVEAFPFVSLWDQGRTPIFQAPAGYMLVVGSKMPLRIDVEALGRRMRHPAVQADLEAIGIETPAALLSLFVLGSEQTAMWTAGFEPVTDDLTVVDYAAARSVRSGFGLGFFRLEGDARHVWLGRLTEVGRLYQQLREPIGPFLAGDVDHAEVLEQVAVRHAAFDRELSEWASSRGRNRPQP